jgi:RNA polymerase sigma-70 factor (ECF subfamily)
MDGSSAHPGTQAGFATTRWSLVCAARDADAAGRRDHLAELIRLYWRPVYAFIRRRWHKSAEDAKDLTQGFFGDLLERSFLDAVAPERGRFRSFLLACLSHYLSGEYDRENALKRGGGRPPVSLECIRAADIEAGDGDPARVFEREWAQAVLAEALTRTREAYATEGRPVYFTVLERALESDRPAYEEIAAALGIGRGDVSNYLVHARARLRGFVQEIVKDSVGSDADWKAELAALFGTSP